MRSLLLWCLLGAVSAADVETIGGGSIPAQPPAGEKDTAELFARRPLIEPASAGKPQPTNDWWTTLLMEPFPTKLWAMPATVGATADGVRVWFPQGWNEGGNELVQGAPLEVLAVDRAPAGPDADLVVADFDGAAWPAGWEATGNAWGAKPATANARNVGNVAGRGYADSFAVKGDAGTGELASPLFAIQREWIHLLVAGGTDAASTHADLEVDGKVVASASGRNATQLEWKRWDVRQYKGRKARIRLVDSGGGGWGFLAVDRIVQSATEATPAGGALGSCAVVDWGDWHVRFRLRAAPGRWCDVTTARGAPYVWIEPKELDLRIPVGDGKVTDLGKDALLLERDGRLFCLVAPGFTRTADTIEPVFTAKERFLAVGLVPDRAQAELIRAYAGVVPRGTRFAWVHDAAAGEVATIWTTTSDVLHGSEKQPLQGWLPHHYRTTRNDLTFTPAEFATQRGKLRLATGSVAKVAWPFVGLLPTYPAPSAADAPRLAGLIAQWAGERKPGKYGDDTYWGAKDVLGLATHFTMASELKLPSAAPLHGLLTDCLSDWFTYTPGEKAHYFARYGAPWNGVVGFKSSYGSAAFTDNHFHYGYFTLSAALLARQDPTWAKAFGPVATLVAKQYANWDRDDKAFPFLRTFDPWAGHSYAGGGSNPNDGNNQESTSESMQGWAGVFLLGAALGDDGMRACGAMGWAIESEATREYWFDAYGTNFPPQYKAKNAIVSVLRDRDQGFWTWFSGKPIHVYGIQWLPQWTSLQYLGRDPAAFSQQFDGMLAREKSDIRGLGDDWGNVALGALAFADPARVLKEIDAAAAANDKLAGFARATTTTYQAASLRALGPIAWDAHADLPTSTVFQRDGKLTLVAWNPGTAPITATVRRGAAVVGSAKVPAGALVTVPLK